jgi:ubiquinone/menaquinone biosynthesis C-methylase UbiE
MKNQKTKFWDSLAKKYDGLIEKYAYQTYHAVFNLIKNELEPHHEILEIGTGTGIVAQAIAPGVKSIVAIDSSEGMIEIARSKQEKENINNVSFSVDNAYELSHKENSFDAVIAMNIIHLLPKPEKVVEELKKVVKNGGKIFVPTYCHGENFTSLLLSYLSSLSGFKVPNRWSVNKFHSFLKSAGLEIKDEKTFPGRFPLAYVVLTIS